MMACRVMAVARQGWTPLGLAAKAKNVEMVKYLLENKAEPNVCLQSALGQSLSIVCSFFAGLFLIFHRPLAEHPFPFVLRSDEMLRIRSLQVGDGTALRAASRAGCMASCELLLEYGADLFAIDKEGKDAVEVALLSKKKECARFLQQRIAALAARNVRLLSFCLFPPFSLAEYMPACFLRLSPISSPPALLLHYSVSDPKPGAGAMFSLAVQIRRHVS